MYFLDRIEAAPRGAIAVGARVEICLEDRHKHHPAPLPNYDFNDCCDLAAEGKLRDNVTR
jgi:hypothetical protein